MNFNDYSFRHGKELLKMLHPGIFNEIISILRRLPPYPHGREKNKTVKISLTEAFKTRGWETEKKEYFSKDKDDYIDLFKPMVAIEMEFSRFEAFFRDFFRFIILYEKKIIDVGIILTLDESAFKRFQDGVNPYKSSKAYLQKLIDFLEGDYCTKIYVPMWCIGIE